MNSSRRSQLRALAPVQAEQFLTELANLRRELGALTRFRRRFAPFIPERQTPFAAVETLPNRERQPDNSSAQPGRAVLSAAEAFRTGRYRGAGTPPTTSSDPSDPISGRDDGHPKGEMRADAALPSEHTTPNIAAESISVEATMAPPLPYRPAASDTDSPSRGILRGSPKPIDLNEQDILWIWTLHEHLCHVWDQPDQRTREWGVVLLLLLARGEAGSRHLSLLGFPGPLPPPTLFEQALLWLVDVRDRARHCQNPECVAPYFFAKRRSQKYCSEVCALPAQREFKRRWWAEHGSEQRTRRVRSQKVKKAR